LHSLSPIVIWLRITSGFTSNCSAGHLLERQPRTLITVAAIYDRRPPRSLLIAPCFVPLPVVPAPRVVLRSMIRNFSDPPVPWAARLSAPPCDIAQAIRMVATVLVPLVITH